MTEPEFKQWFAHHRASFPEVDAWLGKYDKGPRGPDDLSSRDVLKRWFAGMKDTLLDDARAATDAMFRGDEEQPKVFSETVREINRIARKLSSQRMRENAQPQLQRRVHDRTNEVGQMTLGDAWRTLRSGGEPEDLGGAEESFRCIVCQDSGLVTIYLPLSIQRRVEGDDKYPLYTAAVACHCDLGVDKLRHVKIRFDQRRHCLVNAVRPADRLAEVQAFVGAMAGSRAEQWQGNPDDYARQFGQEGF